MIISSLSFSPNLINFFIQLLCRLAWKLFSLWGEGFNTYGISASMISKLDSTQRQQNKSSLSFGTVCFRDKWSIPSADSFVPTITRSYTRIGFAISNVEVVKFQLYLRSLWPLLVFSIRWAYLVCHANHSATDDNTKYYPRHPDIFCWFYGWFVMAYTCTWYAKICCNILKGIFSWHAQYADCI